jgi:hypothetical protein
MCGGQRDREGWPLLTVETEVYGDSKRTHESGPFLTKKVGLDCSTVFGPVQNFFSSPYTISVSLTPIAQQAGQAAVLGRLSLSVCLWWWGGRYMYYLLVYRTNLHWSLYYRDDDVCVVCTSTVHGTT